MAEQNKKLSKYASLDNIVKNNFYEVNKDEIECPICNLLIIGPMQCPDCQSSLCSGCAADCKKCPICRKEVKYQKSIMLNKLLSKLSFQCQNCKEEILYDNLISHHEKKGNCKLSSDLNEEDNYKKKYFEVLEKMKKLEIENCKLEAKLESVNYKLKCSEDKNKETISSLKSMNEMLLKKESESNDMLMKSIEDLRKSKSSEITQSTSNYGLNIRETFKSRYHNHTLNYQRPEYKTALCDICRRCIYNIKNYHCEKCKFDMCLNCKEIEEELSIIKISTPLHQHPLKYKGNEYIAECDLCGSNSKVPFSFYNCSSCKFDSCEKCFRTFKW